MCLAHEINVDLATSPLTALFPLRVWFISSDVSFTFDTSLASPGVNTNLYTIRLAEEWRFD